MDDAHGQSAPALYSGKGGNSNLGADSARQPVAPSVELRSALHQFLLLNKFSPQCGGHITGTDMDTIFRARTSTQSFDKYMIDYFWKLHKDNVKQLVEKYTKANGDWKKMPIVFFLRYEDLTRPDTTNWQRKRKLGNDEAASGAEGSLSTKTRERWSLRYDEFMAKVKHLHCGEVRVWQSDPELWRSDLTLNRALTSIDFGANNGLCSVSTSGAARGAEGSLVLARPDEAFSLHIYREDCMPNFADPISTFAVRDSTNRERVCIRDVRGITLAEVLNHYSDDFSFYALYEVWLEGKILVRSRASRGVRKPARGGQPVAVGTARSLGITASGVRLGVAATRARACSLIVAILNKL